MYLSYVIKNEERFSSRTVYMLEMIVIEIRNWRRMERFYFWYFYVLYGNIEKKLKWKNWSNKTLYWIRVDKNTTTFISFGLISVLSSKSTVKWISLINLNCNLLSFRFSCTYVRSQISDYSNKLKLTGFFRFSKFRGFWFIFSLGFMLLMWTNLLLK